MITKFFISELKVVLNLQKCESISYSSHLYYYIYVCISQLKLYSYQLTKNCNRKYYYLILIELNSYVSA